MIARHGASLVMAGQPARTFVRYVVPLTAATLIVDARVASGDRGAAQQGEERP